MIGFDYVKCSSFFSFFSRLSFFGWRWGQNIRVITFFTISILTFIFWWSKIIVKMWLDQPTIFMYFLNLKYPHQTIIIAYILSCSFDSTYTIIQVIIAQNQMWQKEPELHHKRQRKLMLDTNWLNQKYFLTNVLINALK